MSRPLAVIFVLIFALVAMSSAQPGNFTGFYVGVNLGGASGTSDAKTTTIFSPTGYFAMTSPGAIAIAGRQQLTPTSFTGGGQAGFNFQISHIVLGAEVDFGHMQLSQSMQKSGPYPCCAPTGFTATPSLSTACFFTPPHPLSSTFAH